MIRVSLFLPYFANRLCRFLEAFVIYGKKDKSKIRAVADRSAAYWRSPHGSL